MVTIKELEIYSKSLISKMEKPKSIFEGLRLQAEKNTTKNITLKFID